MQRPLRWKGTEQIKDQISFLHRVLLWFNVIPGAAFALGYYFAPTGFSKVLGVEVTDPAAIQSIGGFLMATVIASIFSLLSGKWSEVRIPTYYMMVWNILNGIAIGYRMASGAAPMALLPNLIYLFITGGGFALVVLGRSGLFSSTSVKTSSV